MANSVRQTKQEYLENISKKIAVYNPEVDDFEARWQGKTYKILGKTIERLDFYQAGHAIRHLTDFVMNKRKLSGDEERAKVLAEISVEL